MRRRLRALGALLVCAACSDSGPRAGRLVLTLETERTGDGALLVLVAGGPVTAAQAGTREIALTSDSAGTHLLIVGGLAAGEIATIDIPDLDEADRYVGVVEQVAHGTSYILLDPADYRIALRPAGSP